MKSLTTKLIAALILGALSLISFNLWADDLPEDADLVRMHRFEIASETVDGIYVGGANIHIKEGADGEATVMVLVEFKRGAEEGAAVFDAIVDLDFIQEGDRIHFTMSPVNQEEWEAFRKKHRPSIDVVATLPRAFDIRAKTTGGHVALKGREGTVGIQTMGGHITVEEVVGDLKAKTMGGHLNVTNSDVRAELETMGGHIKVRTARGSLYARTGGGHIDVVLTGQPDGDCRFHTGGGHVKLAIDESVGAQLKAQTSGGRVRVDVGEHSSDSSEKKNHMRYEVTLAGGGPLIELKTAGGNIEVRETEG